MQLFVHAETTGIYKSTLDLTDPAQPHLCRFSLVARRSEDHCVINTANLLVRCEHPIPAGAYNVHGIDQAATQECGVPPKAAHALLARHLALGPTVYGYNVEFVLGCLAVQAARVGDPLDLDKIKHACVMDEAYQFMYGDEPDCGQMKLPRFEESWSVIMRANKLGMVGLEAHPDRALRVFDIVRMQDRIVALGEAGCGHLSKLNSDDDHLGVNSTSPSGLPPMTGDEHPNAPVDTATPDGDDAWMGR